MDRFSRVVLGYHGCLESRATALLSGTLPIERWPPSDDQFEWLGRGIYFWEHGPRRALQWAQEKAARSPTGERPAVVGAVIQLARCLDLTDLEATGLLEGVHRRLTRSYERMGKKLPVNQRLAQGDLGERKKRYLDCLVVNALMGKMRRAGRPFQSVRAAFWEGEELYPGAAFRRSTHIQIAVADPACILGVFRPNLEQR